MSWFLHQLPSFAVCVYSYVAFRIAGKKNRLGWLLALISEAFWMAYGVWAKQYGLIPGSLLFALVFYKNWRDWKVAPA